MIRAGEVLDCGDCGASSRRWIAMSPIRVLPEPVGAVQITLLFIARGRIDSSCQSSSGKLNFKGIVSWVGLREGEGFG